MSEMKFVELHGERVAYREAGAGEALLLIHGMAGSSVEEISGGGTGPVRAW